MGGRTEVPKAPIERDAKAGGGLRGGGVPIPVEVGVLKGAVPHPQKIFDYSVMKWRILMHISHILT